MSKDDSLFYLQEARMHLQALNVELENEGDGQDSRMALSYRYADVLRQLCLSWNSLELSAHSIEQLTDNEHDELCHRIPNWDESFSIDSQTRAKEKGTGVDFEE